MQLLLLLALFTLANKPKGPLSNAAPMPPRLAGPRRRVKGGSGRTWFAKDVHDVFGSDRTDVVNTSVFADETSAELVIAFTEYPEAQVRFKDGTSIKQKQVRVLFYASPSALTKDAIADFLS
jgi:hypothetical protein